MYIQTILILFDACSFKPFKMSGIKINYSVLSGYIIQKQNLYEVIKKMFAFSETEFNNGPKQKIERFIKTHDTKFKNECHCNIKTFEMKNKTWLNRELCLDSQQVERQVDTGSEDQVDSTVEIHEDNSTILQLKPKSTRKAQVDRVSKQRKSVAKNRLIAGRIQKLKPFDQCSQRTQRRRCDDVLSTFSENQINDVYLDYLKKNDRKLEAKIVQKLRSASPERMNKILEILNEDQNVIPYTPDEALALIMDADLSTHQYEIIQKQAKLRKANIYPSYYYILASKKLCYPSNDSIQISETCVNIQLQPLLDHTIQRYKQNLQIFNTNVHIHTSRKSDSFK